MLWVYLIQIRLLFFWFWLGHVACCKSTVPWCCPCESRFQIMTYVFEFFLFFQNFIYFFDFFLLCLMFGGLIVLNNSPTLSCTYSYKLFLSLWKADTTNRIMMQMGWRIGLLISVLRGCLCLPGLRLPRGRERERRVNSSLKVIDRILFFFCWNFNVIYDIKWVCIYTCTKLSFPLHWIDNEVQASAIWQSSYDE